MEQDSPAIRDAVTLVGNVGELFAALAQAQASFATIVKDSTATVPGKEGKAGYSFDYAGLDVVLAAIRPGLASAGLAVSQVFSGMGSELTTILAHGASDSYMMVTCALPEWKGAQGLGSALTYLKRYQLLGMLSVAPSDDDDGNEAMGNAAHIAKRNPPAVKQAPAAAKADPNALTPQTKARIGDLGKAVGFNREELEAFAIKHKCGALASLNEVTGLLLVTALEGLKVQP